MHLRTGAVFGLCASGAHGIAEAMSARVAHLGDREVITAPAADIFLGMRTDEPPQRNGSAPAMALEDASAFAGYDPDREALVLANGWAAHRPIHIAPLANGWAFATDVAALQAVPDLLLRASTAVVAHVLRFGELPRGACLLAGMRLVMPGQVARIWNDRIEVAAMPPDTPAPVAASGDVFADFRRALVAAAQRMTGEAEAIGFALTPGFGPLLALGALRWSVRDRPLHTYAVGFGHEDPFLERAQSVARHFCTEHHSIVVTPAQVRATLQELIRHTEDPLTSEQALELLLIAKRAGAEVPVLIDGFSNGSHIHAAAGWGGMRWISARIHGAARMPGGSLFRDAAIRECGARVPEMKRGADRARVAAALSAGMLAKGLLAEPTLVRRLHPSRVFVREMLEGCRDLLGAQGALSALDLPHRSARSLARLESKEERRCLPQGDWARVMLALWAQEFLTHDVQGMEIAARPAKWQTTEWQKGGKSWQAYGPLKS
jgi:hypothetical protein